jgi:hypothetical protein
MSIDQITNKGLLATPLPANMLSGYSQQSNEGTKVN